LTGSRAVSGIDAPQTKTGHLNVGPVANSTRLDGRAAAAAVPRNTGPDAAAIRQLPPRPSGRSALRQGRQHGACVGILMKASTMPPLETRPDGIVGPSAGEQPGTLCRVGCERIHKAMDA